MPMDPRLHGVVPANQQHARPKTVPKTAQQEAKARHQSPATDTHAQMERSDYFGLGTVPVEMIESQILKGIGAWHPANKKQIPLDVLKKDYFTLKKSMGKKPAQPSPYEFLKDHTTPSKNVPTPFHFYKQLGGVSEPTTLNRIDIEEKSAGHAVEHSFNTNNSDEEGEGKTYAMQHTHASASFSDSVSLTNFPQYILRNVASNNTFYPDRAEAYKQYFLWLSEVCADTVSIGDKYNKRLAEWEEKNHVLTSLHELITKQQAYNNSLTDLHRKEIMRDELLKEQSQDIQRLVDEQVQAALAAMNIQPKRGRGRPAGSRNKKTIEREQQEAKKNAGV